MIGIDTNVLVRFMITDDPVQHLVARQFMSERSAADPAFVSLIVLAETVWILRKVRRYGQAAVTAALRALLDSDVFVFEEHDFLTRLLADDLPTGVDIADHLISHSAKKCGCRSTVTFDKSAARLVPGMKLLA